MANGQLSVNDLLRQKFQELKTQEAVILAESKPHRDAVDALQPQIETLLEQKRGHGSQARTIEEPLADVRREMASISRALSGKTTIERA